jgi:uncharacterized tellurite resistance protein B-like protein
MHIVALILAVLGGAGVVLWRLYMAAEAARGLADAANDARGFFRRRSWQRKFAKSNLDLVQDPREAVAAMMVSLAQSDGAMTERERRAVLTAIVQRFGSSGQQAEELLAHGRWLVRDVQEAGDCFRKLTPFLKKSCSRDQIRDLLSMLDSVANAEGPPGGVEASALKQLRLALEPRG